MALPSQSARTTPAGRTFVYRGRRRKRTVPPQAALIGVGGVLVVGLLVGGAKLLGSGGAKEANASEAATPVAAAEPEASPAIRHEPKDPRRTAGAPSTETASALPPSVISLGSASRGAPQNAGELPVRAPASTTRSNPLGEAVRSGEPLGRVPDPAPATRSEPAAPAAGSPATPSGGAAPVRRAMEEAERQIAQNNPLAAREILNRAMRERGVTDLDRAVLRDRLASINEELVFGPKVFPGDAISEHYKVQRGDSLAKIVRARDLGVHWKLIQRVNRLASPERIMVGQTLKLVRGPFHAVVDKSEYRLDLYHGPTEIPAEWTYIRSFRVGLGEGDSTPLGRFIVKPNSKLQNPAWVNPRTGEKFDRDDPNIPIGEYWIAMEGLGDAAAYVGYGLHGTNEPHSIGKQMSMGCVRLGDEDIALIFELLEERISIVEVRP